MVWSEKFQFFKQSSLLPGSRIVSLFWQIRAHLISYGTAIAGNACLIKKHMTRLLDRKNNFSNFVRLRAIFGLKVPLFWTPYTILLIKVIFKLIQI